VHCGAHSLNVVQGAVSGTAANCDSLSMIGAVINFLRESPVAEICWNMYNGMNMYNEPETAVCHDGFCVKLP
jgi:hypothetical protein